MKHIFDSPISIMHDATDASAYGSVEVDETNPLFREPLVDIAEGGIAGECYYHRSDGLNAPYYQRIKGSLTKNFVRTSVLERLIHVNQTVKQFDREIYVWNSYRPIQTQMGLWEFFRARVREDHPDLGEDGVYEHVIKYVSDPSHFNENDPTSWPTHSTGAAIDLTLRDRKTGNLVDMGASFDEMGEAAHSDYLEKQRINGACDKDFPPLLNRRFLIGAMRSAGFENYPMEYWHFDWGNQMHMFNLARENGARPGKAWYGFCKL